MEELKDKEENPKQIMAIDTLYNVHEYKRHDLGHGAFFNQIFELINLF